MNLVNMKVDMSDGCCTPCPESAYPYGLRICLNDEQCQALGILGTVGTGAKMNVIANATVVMCREEAAVDAPKSDIYLDLQITDMALAPPNMMYPNSKMEK